MQSTTCGFLPCLDLAVFPQFIFPPLDTNAPWPESVTLQCLATGIPTVTYTWHHVMTGPGGEEVLESVIGNGVTVSEGNLTFNPSRREDAGMYRCVANNVHGEISGDATLEILGEHWDMYNIIIIIRAKSVIRDKSIIRDTCRVRVYH